MSQINLFRALPQDPRQASVTIPKDAFVNMPVNSKTFTTQIYGGTEQALEKQLSTLLEQYMRCIVAKNYHIPAPILGKATTFHPGPRLVREDRSDLREGRGAILNKEMSGGDGGAVA